MWRYLGQVAYGTLCSPERKVLVKALVFRAHHAEIATFRVLPSRLPVCIRCRENVASHLQKYRIYLKRMQVSIAVLLAWCCSDSPGGGPGVVAFFFVHVKLPQRQYTSTRLNACPKYPTQSL